jgi:hypothetical protein
MHFKVDNNFSCFLLDPVGAIVHKTIIAPASHRFHFNLLHSATNTNDNMCSISTKMRSFDFFCVGFSFNYPTLIIDGASWNCSCRHCFRYSRCVSLRATDSWYYRIGMLFRMCLSHDWR